MGNETLNYRLVGTIILSCIIFQFFIRKTLKHIYRKDTSQVCNLPRVDWIESLIKHFLTVSPGLCYIYFKEPADYFSHEFWAQSSSEWGLFGILYLVAVEILDLWDGLSPIFVLHHISTIIGCVCTMLSPSGSLGLVAMLTIGEIGSTSFVCHCLYETPVFYLITMCLSNILCVCITYWYCSTLDNPILYRIIFLSLGFFLLAFRQWYVYDNFCKLSFVFCMHQFLLFS